MPLSLHHLAFRTADVAGLAGFYRDVFGFATVREEPPRRIWLELGADSMLMIERRSDGESALPAGCMDLVAFRVGAAMRDAIRDHAMRLGCFEGETAWTVYLRDPDGRRVGASVYEFAPGAPAAEAPARTAGKTTEKAGV